MNYYNTYIEYEIMNIEIKINYLCVILNKLFIMLKYFMNIQNIYKDISSYGRNLKNLYSR